ncbi:hypothetical protein [Paenibacillus sp.]|uniref:hypothetical protein n=1 Tax=Paenibacillus sp. TaxID=58172 RepID=UPI002D6B55A3|nr:hypothetical protein [Paenibacillus sp.]HZG86377.1 hypothetical protein [Paenibacillus sp.]
MKKRSVRVRILAVLAVLAVALILVIVGIWLHLLNRFPLEETALESHVKEQFINAGTMTKADLEIEEINEIGNYKTILFSVHDAETPSPAPRLGFAFYERSRLGNTYRFDGMGWGTNTFDSYLFEAFTGKRKETFFVVYGRNPSDSKEFERFKITFHGEVFVGNIAKEEYFVEIFPVANPSFQESGVAAIAFETKDLRTESFPLPITSKIK